MPSALELLGPGGPLAAALGGYEERGGQLAMAQAVERTLRDDRVLLCEAGTGTGKTLAYLLPAVLSGRKVIISTATRALQEQIYFNDLPLVARALDVDPRATLLKGLSNYLCRRRFQELRESAAAAEPARGRTLDLVARWVEETESGDLGELATLAEDDVVRLGVASSSETRLGQSCVHHDACFVTRVRREAEAARIVIVNHHLFFADLALRGAHPGRVLPDYDAVIFDEAHQLEDIATEFFGLRVTAGQLRRALSDAERALRLAGATDALFSPKTHAVVERAEASADRLFAELSRRVPHGEARVTLERDAWSGPLEAAWLEVDAALEGVEVSAQAARGKVEASRPLGLGSIVDALEATTRRMALARERLAAIVDGGAGRVTWIESGPRGAALSSSPVDLSWVLKERVFETVPAVVLTSATLATRARRESGGSPFGYVRSRLGLAGDAVKVDELVVESPFDFARQALFYTPNDLPSPGSSDFIASAAERVRRLIELTGGGCFVLTTSLRSMRGFFEQLGPHLPRERLLMQGQAPKMTLLGRFRAKADAVLVATASFWEGVDVPGQALRLVVLEKIPFAVPSDPIVRARALALETEGQNPFIELHVPAAAIALKQGFGRLVRTRRDVGIVALLDERVHRRGYGRTMLEALPPATRTTDFGDVERFWSARGSAAVPIG